jgi:hypothetical protein
MDTIQAGDWPRLYSIAVATNSEEAAKLLG